MLICKLISYKRYNIPTRSKKDSRDLALKNGRIKFTKNVYGKESVKTLHQIKYDSEFFKKWSKKLAYVLGLIFTDGNIHYNKSSLNTTYRQGRLTFVQKDIELILKFADLIGFENEPAFRKRRKKGSIVSGESYAITINNNDLLADLENLGITENKSKSMLFPKVPNIYLSHFIRGCWDGDGTVYVENNGRIRASFISGSYEFIEELMIKLEGLGLSKRKLYTHGHSESYYFMYVSDKDCLRLYNLMYDSVYENIYYSKKFEIFRNYFNKDPTSAIY